MLDTVLPTGTVSVNTLFEICALSQLIFQLGKTDDKYRKGQVVKKGAKQNKGGKVKL